MMSLRAQVKPRSDPALIGGTVYHLMLAICKSSAITVHKFTNRHQSQTISAGIIESSMGESPKMYRRLNDG